MTISFKVRYSTSYLGGEEGCSIPHVIKEEDACTLINMSSISEEDELERQALIDSIPEFAFFENQKENILPLKGGRRAKALASLFQLSDDEKQLMIQQAQLDMNRN
ncbi:unnamed protein product [Cunninghamella blakesleeana]